MLGRRATSTSFVHAATGHQRHDRQHLGRGPQLHDREQVGQVVAQDVACGADGVQTAHHTLQRVTHGTHLAHDLDVQTGRIVLVQVHPDLGDQLRFVRAVLVEPKHHGHAGVTTAGHSQFDPVADRRILALAHAPDVASFHVFGQQHFARVQIGDVGDTVFGDLKGFVVRSVFFGLLRHQAHIRHGAHGLGIEVAMPFAEVDHLLVNAGKGRLRHHRLDVFQPAVGAPHLAAVSDHGGHGGIDDHIVGRMEVGDALSRVHHRELRPVLMTSMQVTVDFVLLGLRQGGDLAVQVSHAVVHVHAQFVKQFGMLGKRVFVENFHTVTEHDGVRDLHHGGFHVQGKHHAGFVRVFDLLFIKNFQRFFTHEHAVNDFTVEQGHFLLQHHGLATLGDQLHFHVTGAVQRNGFFAVVKIAAVHVRDMRARSLAPLGHAVGVLARKLFHGAGRTAVRVAFAQHRVHGRANALAVTGTDFFFSVCFGRFRIIGQGITLGLQLFDGRPQLAHRGADVGQLDDVGFGLQSQLAQFSQVVRQTLRFGQHV